VYDLHIHSSYSDGNASVDEIARKAKERGLKLIAIVDHSKELPFGLTERKAKNRQIEIENARSKYGIEILSGIECSINSAGEIILPDFKFDFVIASVHEFVSGEAYYRRIFDCMDCYDFDVLGHPFSKLFGFDENIGELDMKLIDKLEERSIALEINSSHHCPPDEFLELCRGRDLKYSIGSDAHILSKAGDVEWSVKKAKTYLNTSRLFIL
jgi:putative hydrolase